MKYENKILTKKGITVFKKSNKTQKILFEVNLYDADILNLLIRKRNNLLRLFLDEYHFSIDENDIMFIEIEHMLIEIVGKLRDKWIKDISDWLEINNGTNGENLQSFLHFFEERMQSFLVEDKKEWKEIVKYYREHGELPMPKEIKFKK